LANLKKAETKGLPHPARQTASFLMPGIRDRKKRGTSLEQYELKLALIPERSPFTERSLSEEQISLTN
jgi:hypothetical protein